MPQIYWATTCSNCATRYRAHMPLVGLDPYVCQGPDEQLQQTEFSQPAVMIAALAAAEKWRLLCPKEHRPGRIPRCAWPDVGLWCSKIVALAGFSLGEFSALVFSGAVSFEDGVRLVKARAEAMNECAQRHQGAMASVAGMEVPPAPGNTPKNAHTTSRAGRETRRALQEGDQSV